MEYFLGESADFVGEGQRFGEVFEGVFFLEVMAVDDLPVVAEFGGEFFQCLAGERGDAALAGFAFALG
jgi:hypothetical protein